MRIMLTASALRAHAVGRRTLAANKFVDRKRSALAALGLFLLASLPCAATERDFAINSLQPLPPGTTVPVELARAMKAGSVKVGTRFVVRTTQRIPVGPHRYLPRGVEVLGEVIASDNGDAAAGKPSMLTLDFSELVWKGQSVPVRAKTIAIANFVQVMDAAVIATGATDRGNPDPAGWTTNQVGGDQVYRSGWRGDVYSSYSHKVGFADYHGVYASPKTPQSLPQALGVFSTTSSGLYGFAGSTMLSGEGSKTTISDLSRAVVLRKGDDLLLQVSCERVGK